MNPLSVLYDMDYNFTNHTMIFSKINSEIIEFLSFYWFQTFTSFSIVFILLYLNHLDRRLGFLENFFEEHLKMHVGDAENFLELKDILEEILNKTEKNKHCKAIANWRFEKRRGLVQCENLAEEGSDFCEIHDERDVPLKEDLEYSDDSEESENDSNDSDYEYESVEE